LNASSVFTFNLKTKEKSYYWYVHYISKKHSIRVKLHPRSVKRFKN